MRKWKYFGCICLIGLAVLGAYFLPQMTSVYTDRKTEGKIYTETMQAFTSEKETVKERCQRVMDGVKHTGMLWGDGQDVRTGDFRKRVKKELQTMRAVGLLPKTFTWKWIGKAKYVMTAYYWNLNENIEDYGDLGLWHIFVACDDMNVELDMDAATYKIYHVSIQGPGVERDKCNVPKREEWEKGFEQYYEFAPMETEKIIPNKMYLWEEDIYEDEIYWYRFLNYYDEYSSKTSYGAYGDETTYYYVQGFSTLSNMRWDPEIWGTDVDTTYDDKSVSSQQ